MGHVEVEVVLRNLNEDRSLKATALVDTGATLTVLPEGLAKQLGLVKTGEKVKVSTAKGYEVLELAHVVLEVMGRKRIQPALLSESLDRVLLGVTSLEAAQLKVNPLTEKLEEYTALLY